MTTKTLKVLAAAAIAKPVIMTGSMLALRHFYYEDYCSPVCAARYANRTGLLALFVPNTPPFLCCYHTFRY